MGYRGEYGVVLFAACVAAMMGCSGDGGPAATDTVYTLSCPATVGCGSLSEDTCLRPPGAPVGTREIFASNGDIGCDDETTTIVVCQATATSDDRLIIELEALVGAFGINTRITASGEGSAIEGTCLVTVVEDDLSYGGVLGACGIEPPSMEQPCQISNFTVDDTSSVNVSFDLTCEALLSDVTEDGFDVDASLQFARCTGL